MPTQQPINFLVETVKRGLAPYASCLTIGLAIVALGRLEKRIGELQELAQVKPTHFTH